MKRFILIFFSIVWFLSVGLAWAESPVHLTHSITGYKADAENVTLNYSLYVENPGDTPVQGLILSHVPLPFVTKEEVFLNIGDLEAHGTRDITFTLITPMLLSQEEFSAHPLFWAGTYTDGSGNTIEFPAESRIAGGMQ